MTFRPREQVPEGTHGELVASLFATRLPTLVMSTLFATVGWLMVSRTGDRAIGVLVIAGLLASGLRVAVMLGHRPAFADGPPAPDAVRAIERRFTVCYATFACLLGLFGMRSFQLDVPDLHRVVAALIVGYAAGAAAGTSLRPWIAVPSVLFAVLPTTIAAALAGDATSRVFATVLGALASGGVVSMLARYRAAVAEITLRRTVSQLAREDHLTGLANRLALAERFAAIAAQAGRGAGVAVHCLDLDTFKPINDRLGHPAGDAILKAVATRLASLMRAGDVAARVGGDEFVVVQSGVAHADDAAAFARQIERCLAEPYRVAGLVVGVGASVGHTVSFAPRADLDTLVAAADALMLDRKARNRAAGEAPSRPACAEPVATDG